MNMKKMMSYLLSFGLISFSALSAQQYGYVSNGTVVTQLNLDSGTSQNLAAAFTFAGPSVVTSDGKTLYVLDSAAGLVREINLTLTPPAATGKTFATGPSPIDIAITPDDLQLYVTNGELTSGTVSAFVISTSATQSIPVGDRPSGIVITSDGFAYVVNSDSQTITYFDTAMTFPGPPPLASFPIGGVFPYWIAATSDGLLGYVTDLNNSIAAGQVLEIDLPGHAATANTIPVGVDPLFIAIAPDDSVAYVSNFVDGTVTHFDILTLSPDNITVETGPQGIAFSSDSATAYVANSGSASVSVIDVATATPSDPATPVAGTPFFITLSDYPLPLPVVTDLSPNFGTPAGGTEVQINGQDFTGATSVTFDGVPALPYTVSDDGSFITAVAPPHGAGIVDVVVTTPAGPSAVSSGSKYSYIFPIPVVSALTPSSGSAGTTVVISGLNFFGTTSVTFNGVQATILSVTDTAITVIAPPGSGLAQVIVSNPGGSSSPTLASQFNYGGGAAGNVSAPRNLRGYQCKKVTSHHPVNLIRFKKPRTGNKPVEYRIYRDPGLTDLAKTVKAGRKLQFKDRNRECGVVYSYYVVSVDAAGAVSAPASVTVTPKR